jgi:site-specific recombinase XerD
MARQAKPFYYPCKGTWYVRIDGRRTSLGVQGIKAKKQAYDAWHSLIVNGVQVKDDLTINDLTKAFLRDAKERVSVGCYANYSIFADAFLPAFGKRHADDLTNNAVESFARKQSTWSNTYRSQFLGFVVCVYRWAMRERMISVNPIANVKRPPKSSRGVHAVITADEHQTLIAHADDFMRDFLTLLWLTGSRPSEIAGLTAEQIRQSTNGVVVLSNHKSAHHGHARMLILNDEALSIVSRRATQVGEGLLFAGLNGRLTARAIGGRMEHLCRRAKLRNIIAYGYRHTFATDALSKGIADTHVASLLGHSSTTMLHKHYSHLTARTNLLRDVARQVR